MSRFCVQCSWDEVPHLSKKTKDEYYAAIPLYQRDARTKGIPQLGSGVIYPISEEDVQISPFDIPAHFLRVFALDVGWNRTACLWGAIDTDNDVLYCYAEHYRGQAEPSVHAAAIQARGRWIPGVIDPNARGRQQNDGEQLMHSYRGLGLNLIPAINAREAGLFEVWQRMSTGRLKIFSSLRNLISELRVYRRDKKGAVVKENDHLCDCLRYLVMSGLAAASQSPREEWGKVSGKSKHSFDYTPYADGWVVEGTGGVQ